MEWDLAIVTWYIRSAHSQIGSVEGERASTYVKHTTAFERLAQWLEHSVYNRGAASSSLP